MLAKPTSADLSTLAQWLAEGRYQPRIVEQFPLDQAPDAYRLLEGGHVAGKVVVTVNE